MDDELRSEMDAMRAAMSKSWAPSMVVTRAGSLLHVVDLGLDELETASEHDRKLWGLLSVAVFGRSVTLVMQALRTHDETAFDEWYAPWEAEMRSDPLLLYFNRLRVMVLHYDRRGAIGVVVNSSRESDIGSIHIEDLPEPAIHLGLPITDRSVQRLCRLYRNYLRRMFDEFAPVAWAVQDREWAAEAARSENPPPPV